MDERSSHAGYWIIIVVLLVWAGLGTVIAVKTWDHWGPEREDWKKRWDEDTTVLSSDLKTAMAELAKERAARVAAEQRVRELEARLPPAPAPEPAPAPAK